MHSPFVEMIRTVVRRGVDERRLQGRGRSGAALHLDRGTLLLLSLELATLSVIFGRDLLAKDAKDERLAHMVGLVLAALTGQSAALFAMTKAPKSRAAVAQTV